MKMSKLITIVLLMASVAGMANNLQISNVSLVTKSPGTGYAMVKFDISWENSWRISTSPGNWDASWVFVKYRLINQTTWNHATLHSGAVAEGHVVPTGAAIYNTDDSGSGGSYGVFIHRNTDNMGTGNVNFTNVQLRWNYTADGLADEDSVEVCVSGIEMVYIPAGDFALNSGSGETNHFHKAGQESNIYWVRNEQKIVIRNTGDNLYYVADNSFAGDQAGSLFSGFPKGHSAFYCMKYEITQDQYAAFLNKLTATQATTRHPNKNAVRRDNVSGNSPGSYVANAPFLPFNDMSWADLSAYLDWVALRPMTELEFVKACRGEAIPVADEYAWGSSDIANQGYTLSDLGANNEGIASNYSTSAGNALYNGTVGSISAPVRVGIFAAHASTTGRQTAGSSYYGVMELSGNLVEQCVNVGNSRGRRFRANNGNGELSNSGDADVNTWPDTNARGTGLFGGGFENDEGDLRISDRSNAHNPTESRKRKNGGRGVRSGGEGSNLGGG